jgi:hypothetical protein
MVRETKTLPAHLWGSKKSGHPLLHPSPIQTGSNPGVDKNPEAGNNESCASGFSTRSFAGQTPASLKRIAISGLSALWIMILDSLIRMRTGENP